MFTIRMAEKNIQVNNKYDYIKDYCKNYIVNNVAPDFIVEVSDDEILAEKSEEYSSTMGYLERLVNDNIILVHSSVLMVDGQAVMFLAPSGTGKSTHSRLWRQVYGDRVTMINDDKPLVSVRTDNNGTHLNVYGTPWCGKHGIETNTSASVKAIFILKRNEVNEATKMGFRDAFPYIFNQTYRPDNEILMRKTLLLATTFAQNVDIYELGCNMEEEAAKVAYRAVFGE